MLAEKPLYQKNWLLFLGILFISFNLRPSITAVGPLIPMIREDLGLSNGWAGFLTTFPLLTFATFSLFSARIGKAMGNSQALMLGMALILLGTLVRVLGGSLVLFLGTGLTGIGIVICNVLLIPLIKNRMPSKIGIVTASYTTGMTFLAAVASGISAPLAIDLNLGWRGSLVSWAGLLVLGIILWIPQLKFRAAVNHAENSVAKVNVWKSRLAWNVSMFMGVQSLLFFTLVAWLPDMMISRGLSATEAGVLVSVMQIIGLIGSFLAPIIAVRFKDQVGLINVLGFMYIIGFCSLFFDELWVNYVGLAIVGLGLGSSVSLAYTLIGLRTKMEKTTASLSGMVQSTGYYLAALGPLLFGIAFDLFQNWNFLIYLTLTCSVLFIYFGTKAGKSAQI
ncbi:Cyanate transport system protein [Indibacter alkaliphilus LW1]|uniref:Cyanate transport system protein n=1 Tax=Indibacter alkaliphilus (strain CCUG 57479 / KCTC 22604 / LW1) TaxID=1189612 RepID=S2ECL7_INDAL|nr:MFS transporter [Indibacter alkaliphilus]EPA00084.1 Cyanate transport system protein [Indibacter alkaliphilus LW1]